jgi:uncharacterized protein YjeT (DUF2065 family)
MPSANSPANSPANSGLAKPWPPIGGVIRKMAWVAATDLVRQLFGLGVGLISGRRRAARSALSAMSARQLRDIGLAGEQAQIRNRHFSQAEAQIGTVR